MYIILLPVFYLFHADTLWLKHFKGFLYGIGKVATFKNDIPYEILTTYPVAPPEATGFGSTRSSAVF